MKDPRELKEICRKEAYEYFDANIRKLPRNNKGVYKISAKDFYDNDVDAFRHAYTSGVFVQEYTEIVANVLGQLQEIFGKNKKSSQNMDLWNNAVGRKYGKKSKSRKDLADKIKEALENGELIIDPSDSRKYQETINSQIDPFKPVVVLLESKTGRNELFLDLIQGKIMTRQIFAQKIRANKYSGYHLASIDGISTPKSNADMDKRNNLG